MTSKTFGVLIAASSVLALLAASCGGGTPSPATPAATVAPKVSEAPKATEALKATEVPKATEAVTATVAAKATEAAKVTEPAKATEAAKATQPGTATVVNNATAEVTVTVPVATEAVKSTEAAKATEPAPATAPAQSSPAATEAPASAGTGKFRVAFVFVGPVGDLGWSWSHNQGRLALAALPNVETTISESVPEPDSERVFRDYAQKGYNMVFATSFGYMDGVLAAAKDYPKVMFEHATGVKTAANVATYDGRGYEGWYLAGMTAGRMTKGNLLGYVAPYPIPEVVRNLNAFTLGARSVNPKVEVRPIWIMAWFDPQKEREAAQALVDAKADVIARESDSPEPDKVAQEGGVYAIAYNGVQPDVAPKAVLTAPVWNWGIYYKSTVTAALNGEWKMHQYWGHMSDGILDLAPFGSMVPKAVQDEVAAAKAKIVGGQLLPFTGPIKDNTGQLKVAAGQSMSDQGLLSFDWLVEGVKGEIPK